MGQGDSLIWRWPLAGLLAIVLIAAVLGWGVLRDRRDRHARRNHSGGDPARGGAPLAYLARLRGLPRYRRLARIEAWRRGAAAVGVGLALLGTVLLVGRPAEPAGAEPRASRDIVFCLDLSGSMESDNAETIEAVRRMAAGLRGERVGLTVWNARAVTVLPLTDDSAVLDERLSAVAAELDSSTTEAPLTEAAQAPRDAPRMGSSLVGDGWAACIQRFDRPALERSRAVVLVTDNDPQGRGLFTLDDAADLADSRDVVTYAIAGSETAPADRSALEDAAEATGGRVAELDGDADAVVGSIQDSERRRHPDATGPVVLADRTGVPTTLIAVGVLSTWLAGIRRLPALSLSALSPTRWRRRDRSVREMLADVDRRRVRAVLVAAGVVLLLVGPVVARPEGAAAGQRDLDVLVVLDTTTSMAAHDGADGAEGADGAGPDDRSGRTRIEAAREEVDALVEATPGARYALITWGAEAYQELPFTTDGQALRTAVEVAEPEDPRVGTGSALGTPVPLIREVVERAGASDPERRRLIVVLGDGEQRPTDSAADADYSPLAALGEVVVVGYGSSDGARMRWPGREVWVTDATGAPALSRIDEQALRSVADQAQGSYRRAPLPNGGWGRYARSAWQAGGERAERAASGTNLSWVVGWVILALLLVDLPRTVRRTRQGFAELRRLR